MARLSVFVGIFNWCVWLLMAALVSSQFIGIVWDTSTKIDVLFYGRDPREGPYALEGFNDEPYADRALVCLTQGRSYVPMQLSKALADAKIAPIVDTSGSTIDAFRVVRRSDEMTLQPEVADAYTRTCDRIDYTLDTIQESCNALGFNVTRDSLRVVDGVFGNMTRAIPKALPILIVPYWDNAVHSVYVIPGWDGSACIFRLAGMYQYPSASFGVLRGVPREVRETKTREWLQPGNGTWRNGWYEAQGGQRWYSNMMTAKNGGVYGIQARQFDMMAKEEFECHGSETTSLPRCAPLQVDQRWSALTTSISIPREDQVFATNGTRFGLFLYAATTNIYSLETIISNISVFVILIRWFVSLGAMLHGYYRGISTWQTTGVGAVSNSRTFNLLPIVLLPKLKLTLVAFFTVGCNFEGQQLAFSSAWYIIYPAIIEFMLYYYSLLNIIAKITYRRMSDAFFGPTLLALCLLHYFRKEIAESSWFGLNYRLSTFVFSDQLDALKLSDFFTTNVAILLNGKAAPIFYTKLALLALNLLPLFFAENMTEKRGKTQRAYTMCDIERVLALRASHMGGLGRSHVYALRTGKDAVSPVSPDAPMTQLAPVHTDLFRSRATVQPLNDGIDLVRDLTETQLMRAQQTVHDHVLIGYELSRLGYFVFGDRFLLSFDDWYILSSLAPLRWVEKLWNYRITVLDVARTNDDYGSYRVVGSPRLCRLDDARLRVVPFYNVTVGQFQ